MNKQLILSGIVLCLLFPAHLQGQETGLLRMDKKKMYPENDVSVWAGIKDGRLKPTYEAQTQWSAGAEGRFFRPGKTSSWTATVSLEQTMGKHWGSSLFLEPEYYPIDYLDVTAGTASRQTGRVEFGYLRDVSDIWLAGLNATLKAGHQAKRKNVPNSSFGADLRLDPTLTFVMDDDACFVSTYHVQLRTERIKAEQGAGDNLVFLDKGMLHGMYDAGLGAFPVLEFSHGLDGMYWSPDFSAGFGLSWKRGRAGANNLRDYRFPGSVLKGFFEITREGFEIDQVYRVSYQRQRDQLREAAESSYSALSDRVGRDLAFRFGLRPHKGTWKSFDFDLDGKQWSERAYVGSYDAITQYALGATLLSSFTFGQFDVTPELSAYRGFWKERGQTEDVENSPTRLTDTWLKRMDYRTLSRIGAGGTVTWRVPAVEGLSVQLYAYLLRSFHAAHLGGMNREIATLKVTYNY